MEAHTDRKTTPRDVRQNAGWSQARTAVTAGVSEPLVRLYEANPEAVRLTRKREALGRLYAELARTGSSTDLSPTRAA